MAKRKQTFQRAARKRKAERVRKAAHSRAPEPVEPAPAAKPRKSAAKRQD